jgi:cob(I)alamin adenosyltransferase
MAEILSCDQVQRRMQSFFAERIRFLTVVATNLHRLSPIVYAKKQSSQGRNIASELYHIANWADPGYNFFMKSFYTRKGDDGYTGLLQGGRVPKNHPIPEAVGTLDEASAALGVARAACQGNSNSEIILMVQRDLYSIMAEIAASPEHAVQFRQVNDSRVSWLEAQVDLLSAEVTLPKDFIVPGDSPAGAALALARTIVRRAERQVAGLFHSKLVENPELLRYLNRLSSLCFVLELSENQSWVNATPTLARDV